MNTPNYIQSLLAPNTKKPQGKKVWSIDLETVWLPFFTATNTMGDTAIPSDALGCPLRLAYDKAGAVRFSQSGRPVIRVAKEISDNVRLVRDNFTANLINYAGEVMNQNTEAYKTQIELARKAGEPILTARLGWTASFQWFTIPLLQCRGTIQCTLGYGRQFQRLLWAGSLAYSPKEYLGC